MRSETYSLTMPEAGNWETEAPADSWADEGWGPSVASQLAEILLFHLVRNCRWTRSLSSAGAQQLLDVSVPDSSGQRR